MNTLRNTPLDSGKNIPVAVSGQYLGRGNLRRHYIRTEEVKNLAYSKYKENGRGITFGDLLSNRLALRKQQAQTTLKYCLRRGILFTTSNCKPQHY